MACGDGGSVRLCRGTVVFSTGSAVSRILAALSLLSHSCRKFSLFDPFGSFLRSAGFSGLFDLLRTLFSGLPEIFSAGGGGGIFKGRSLSFDSRDEDLSLLSLAPGWLEVFVSLASFRTLSTTVGLRISGLERFRATLAATLAV